MPEKRLECEEITIYQLNTKVKSITLSGSPNGGIITIYDKLGMPTIQLYTDTEGNGQIVNHK